MAIWSKKRDQARAGSLEDAPSPDEIWARHGALSDDHRERLVSSGVSPSILDELRLHEIGGQFPPWWHRRGNALYLAEGLPFPTDVFADVSLTKVAGALVVIASPLQDINRLHLHGDRATVFIGPRSSMPHAEIDCGGDSAIVLTDRVVATARLDLDARNGGSILAEPDQLWASDVLIATDDMHRLEDASTGARLNGFGGRIHLGRHVWLGRDVVVTGNVSLGEDCVAGMRSLVRGGTFTQGTAIAGIPARVIRTGVTWTHEDRAD